MMKIKEIGLLRALVVSAFSICVFAAFADKTVAVRDTDSGEEFQIGLPDGVRIYEYNSNWLDSIPYLTSRARYGEPWAYEALGDCYRYGRGGAERSFFKALSFYELADMDFDELVVDITVNNPKDPMGLFYKLCNKIFDKDREGADCLIDSLSAVGYHDAEILRTFPAGDSAAQACDVDSVRNLLHRIGTDEMNFALLGLANVNIDVERLLEDEELLQIIMEKAPYLYDIFGKKSYEEYLEKREDNSSSELATRAIRFFEGADKQGLLKRDSAEILFNLYIAEIEAGRMEFDEETLMRLATVARMPESETFIFTDK